MKKSLSKEVLQQIVIVAIIIVFTALVCILILYPEMRSILEISVNETDLYSILWILGIILGMISTIIFNFVRHKLKKDNYSGEENSWYDKHRNLISYGTLFSTTGILVITGTVFAHQNGSIDLAGLLLVSLLWWQESLMKNLINKVRMQDELDERNQGCAAVYVMSHLFNVCMILCILGKTLSFSTEFCLGIITTCVAYMVVYKYKLSKLGTDMI